MRKRFKIPLFILIILITILVILIALGVLKDNNENNTIKVLESIDNFGYTLDERDTSLMKDIYHELKDSLTKKEINDEEYATLIAKLFVVDLFTLDNKVNKYDVGSVEYVYPSARDNFKLNVEDTIYKNILNNSNDKRKQELPVVKEVEVTNVQKNNFLIGEKSFESYDVNIKWEYEKDLGYDRSAVITLVKENDKLYVVEYVVAGDNNV